MRGMDVVFKVAGAIVPLILCFVALQFFAVAIVLDRRISSRMLFIGVTSATLIVGIVAVIARLAS
jgi:hypothetical protein